MIVNRRAFVAGALAAPFASRAAFAQAFPSKPVKLVVPFAPGGNADLTGRLFAEAMAKKLGQQVVVENRGGAGGAIGAEAVSKSPPDGYTIVLGSTGTFLVSPRMTGGTPPYTLASFAPVAMLNITSMVLEVNAKNDIKDWPTLLAHLKANPGKFTVGHSGNGSTNHLALLSIQQAAGVRFNIIPYKSMGPALADLLAGQIDAGIDQIPTSLAHIRGGRLRPIVVTSRERSIDLPDTPSLHEAGVANFEAITPLMLMAPAGTPADIVKRLNDAVNDSLKEPEFAKRVVEMGATARPMTPDAVATFMAGEDKVIEELAKTGLLKPE